MNVGNKELESKIVITLAKQILHMTQPDFLLSASTHSHFFLEELFLATDVLGNDQYYLWGRKTDLMAQAEWWGICTLLRAKLISANLSSNCDVQGDTSISAQQRQALTAIVEKNEA